MLIFGAYPETIKRRHSDAPALQDLLCLTLNLPHTAALHILPFGPSDGDGGFAPRDWFAVEPAFGGWDDIRAIAHGRRVIIDGIYNHVGLRHRWVEEFLTRGTGTHRLHVFPFQPHDAVKSPRGGSVFRRYSINDRTWWAWQTFSSCSVDVQLGDAEVQSAISRHLQLLASLGVWGIRLDGAAYFGKRLGEPHVHHPLAIQYAKWISEEADGYGLQVLPQLNCDTQGMSYGLALQGGSTPLWDYGFSAVLALTVITGATTQLVYHLKDTWELPIPILRALRTHDGILMKSPFLRASLRDALCNAFARYDVFPRVIEGDPYEFNVSFPFLCSLGTDSTGMWRRLLTCTALLSCLPGWCYIYLPILYGFRPEVDEAVTSFSDPRSLNRISMPREFIERVQLGGEHKRMLQNLESCVRLRHEYNLDTKQPGDSIDMFGEAAVVLRRAGGRVTVIANFSQYSAVAVPERLGRRSGGTGLDGVRVEPLDFGIWVAD